MSYVKKLQVISNLRDANLPIFMTLKLLESVTNCLLGNFACFFFKVKFFEKKYFRNTIRVSHGLDPDQVRRFVGPDLGPNCLQKLLTDNTSRYRVKRKYVCALL